MSVAKRGAAPAPGLASAPAPAPALVLALLLTACGGADAPEGPPQIAWGEQECARCRMLLSERRFAVGVRSEHEVAAFDDVGCWLAARDPAADRVWVQDHAGGGWVPAEDAWFVLETAIVTPMGSGAIAFAERAAAEEHVARFGGRLARRDELAAPRRHGNRNDSELKRQRAATTTTGSTGSGERR